MEKGEKLFDEVIAEADLLKEMAIDLAKKSISESLTPTIKSLLNQKLAEDLDEFTEQKEMTADDDENDDTTGADETADGEKSMEEALVKKLTEAGVDEATIAAVTKALGEKKHEGDKEHSEENDPEEGEKPVDEAKKDEEETNETVSEDFDLDAILAEMEAEGGDTDESKEGTIQESDDYSKDSEGVSVDVGSDGVLTITVKDSNKSGHKIGSQLGSAFTIHNGNKFYFEPGSKELKYLEGFIENTLTSVDFVDEDDLDVIRDGIKKSKQNSDLTKSKASANRMKSQLKSQPKEKPYEPLKEKEEEEQEIEEAIDIDALLAEDDDMDIEANPEMEDSEAPEKEEVQELKQKLQESNLIMAKLLYQNKLLTEGNLSDTTKAKIITTFSKAKTVNEVKLLFESFKLNNAAPVAKQKTIAESLGFNKTKQEAKKEQPAKTVLSEQALMFQRRAGIKPLY